MFFFFLIYVGFVTTRASPIGIPQGIVVLVWSQH